MKKTNSKEVKAAIRKYLVENLIELKADEWDPEYQDLFNKPKNFETAAELFLTVFYDEKIKYNPYNDDFELIRRNYAGSIYNCFWDWCCGLPSSLNCDWILNKDNFNAKLLLIEWLQETPEEADKYSFEASCDMVGRLLWRELKQGFDVLSLLKSHE